MRPVNLIPPEERRGISAPMRTGRAPYAVIGVMVATLGAIGLLTMTSKALDDKRAEVAQLQVDEKEAKARADALSPFAEFASAREARSMTVDSLARSRFDWERVLSELSKIMPSDIWLIQLAGSVSPSVTLQDGPALPIRADVQSPALEIVGCGRDHEAVAGFLAALRDIDGVTRVTAASSARSDSGSPSAATAAAGAGSNEDCRTRDQVPKFEIVVAFDEVPVPEQAAVGVAPATPAPAEPAPATETASAEAGS